MKKKSASSYHILSIPKKDAGPKMILIALLKSNLTVISERVLKTYPYNVSCNTIIRTLLGAKPFNN